jgi:redox-sensing transcriptional repressor
MAIDISLSNKQTEKQELPLAIPQATLRRLPQYHHYLVQLQARGGKQISCTTIGHDLNFVAVQVRKDLQYTGLPGKPKTGYVVAELVQAIENFLGWNKVNEAFLVGAGNLGTAILGHEKFSQYGLHIVAAFDSDATKVGTRIHGRDVLPLEKLPNLARRMSIRLGIITAPTDAAQSVANLMAEAGIQAIWNFAPVRLKVPAEIFVHNEDLYASLASLSCKLAERLGAPVRNL